MTDKPTKQKTVVEATNYQKYGYYQFMPQMPKFEYNKGGYVFTILPVDGVKDTYRGSCLYINESGDQRILSDNKEALDEYVKNQNAARQNAANKNAANKNAARQNASRQNAARQNVSNQKAPLSPAGDVWIAKMAGSETISKADPNQADAYHKFMSMRKSDPTQFKGEYVYPDSTTIVITTFDGRTGNYPRFCQTVVGGQTIILSDNKEDLESYNNRTQHFKSASEGGNRTKRSRKTKRSKRAHTAKRK
jgi:hypothetical protein